jgi:hypothetical protein
MGDKMTGASHQASMAPGWWPWTRPVAHGRSGVAMTPARAFLLSPDDPGIRLQQTRERVVCRPGSPAGLLAVAPPVRRQTPLSAP